MIIYVIQNKCSKLLAKFKAKFMWTATSNISENRPCLVGCKIIDVLFSRLPTYWFKILSLSIELEFCTDKHPTNLLKLLTQHKW